MNIFVMKKLYIIIAAVLFSVTSISAQNFRTGYFLDGYMYKYQLNPALQGERGFISFPVIGGLGLGLESNLALGTFYYPSDGQLNTFLHPDVSNETFMSKIKDSNPTNLNLDINLLALGFRAKNTYHTLDLSLKSANAFALPGDAFRFMKVGASDGNGTYDLSSLNLSSNTYAQLAYGFSIKIKDFISVGLRAKFLMGIQAAHSDISSLQVALQPERWSVNAEGGLITSSLISSMFQDNLSNEQILNNIMGVFSSPSIGAAVDLGVSVDFLKYFTASASVLDLGFITWKNMERLRISSGSWEFSGFENIGGTGSNPIETQLDAKLDELASIFKFDEVEQLGSYKQQLGFTAMAGLEFRLPFYQRLTVGALATHRFEGANSWTEGRFSLNLAPMRWFSLTANYAISTFGESYGAAVNLHPKGFNLFLGLDSFKPLLNVSPEFIPIDELNTNLKFGVTFPFGKYNGRYPKATAAKDTKQTKSKKESVKKESSKKN